VISTTHNQILVSLERSSGLAPQNVRLQAFHNAQRGKKDDIDFTLSVNNFIFIVAVFIGFSQVFQRKLQSNSQLSRSQAKYNLLKQAFGD